MNPMPRTLGILPAAITALFLVAYLGKEKPVLPSVPEPQAAPDSRTTVAAALAEGANSQACGGQLARYVVVSKLRCPAFYLQCVNQP